MIERIRALLMLRQLTPTQFADLLQIGRPIVSHILSGRNKASLEVVQRITTAFPEVALPWLLSGTGPMLVTQLPEVSTQAAAPSVEAVKKEPAAELTRPVPKARLKATPRALPNSKPASEAAKQGAADLVLAPNMGFRETETAEANSRRQPTRRFIASSSPRPTNPKLEAGGAALVLPSVLQAASADSLSSAPLPETQLVARQQPDQAASYAAPHPQQASLLAAPAAPTAPGAPSPVSGPLPTAAPVPVGQATAWPAADRPIRRIVIFYRDGSFADFQPEA